MCGLPEAWCEKEAESEGGQCTWLDGILPVVRMAFTIDRLQKLAKEEFKDMVDVEDERGYTEWLGRSRQVYETKATNAVAVWEMVVRRTWEKA